ncbi:MAG: dethiobiotin synthase [Vampirovibrionales bacterium]
MYVFITGTDTHIGKTHVTLLLAACGLAQGKRVAVYKPVQTGVNDIKEGDACWIHQQLEHAGWNMDALTVQTGFCYQAPAAPTVASQAEPEAPVVQLDTLIKTVKELKQAHDWVLIEGAGGVYCPVAKHIYIADLIRHFDTPAVVVTPPFLGSINHTLLTVEGLFNRGAKVAGVLVNHPRPLSDEEAQSVAYCTLFGQLVTYVNRPIGQVPYATTQTLLTPDSVLAWWQPNQHVFAGLEA